MNPFVNPNKRTVAEKCRQLIHVILFQVQQDAATELIIGRASGGTTPIRYKVEEMWHELSPFPSDVRPTVISELAKMASFAAGQTVGKGAFDFYIGKLRVLWNVEMTGVDEECRLVCVPGEDPI